MRSRGAFSIIFLEFLSVTKCTTDVNIPELEYVANHLTLKECRWLFTSLHFASFELPAFSEEQELPEDVSCIKLLIRWNNGKECWQGKGKTHENIARRLRQIGRKDVADWLCITVFHKLAQEIEDILVNPGFDVNADKINYEVLAFKENDEVDEDKWNILDTILYICLFGVVGSILFSCWRFLILSCMKDDSLKLDDILTREILSYENYYCNIDRKEEQDELLEKDDRPSCIIER